MKRGHAEILDSPPLEHQRITNLVQSTDQAFHHGVETLAAAIAASGAR
ncbi:hypothetical protein [Kitasatospora sp. NPDC047058]